MLCQSLQLTKIAPFGARALLDTFGATRLFLIGELEIFSG